MSVKDKREKFLNLMSVNLACIEELQKVLKQPEIFTGSSIVLIVADISSHLSSSCESCAFLSKTFSICLPGSCIEYLFYTKRMKSRLSITSYSFFNIV